MNELILYEVVNSKLKQRALLPYKSLVWEECYAAIGTMQCVMARNDDLLGMVHTGMVAAFSPALTLMYIHSIKITDTEIWLYGYEAKALYEKKFAVTDMTQGMTKVNVLNTLSTKIMANRLVWLEGVQGEQIGDADGEANLGVLEYHNMLEFIVQCCKIDDCGYYIGFMDTPTGRKPYFWLKHSVQRNITLCPALGNVSNITYTYTDKPRYNQVIVIGENYDGTPHFAMVSRTDSDMPQGEVYTYLMDIRSEFPCDEDTSYADYDDALYQRARISLGMRKPKQTIEVGNVEQDLAWGDIVTVKLPELGITAQKRVDSITYTIEGGSIKKKYKLGEV